MIQNAIPFATAVARAMARSIAGSLVMLCAAVPASAAAPANCAKVLTEVTSIDLVQEENGTYLVPVKVDGTDHLFLLAPDSFTAVTQKVVDKLGHATGPENTDTYMLGQQLSLRVNISVDLGRIHGDSISLLVMPDPPALDPKADGVLGDILQEYDVELDPKALKLKLFRPDHCPGMGVYWSKSAAALPLTINRIRNISVPMQLDGKDVQVGFSFFDPHPLMGLDIAGDLFGLTPDSPGVTAIKNYTHAASAPVAYHYVFKSLDADGMRINNLGVDLLQTPKPGPIRTRCRHPLCFGGENDFSLGLSELRQLRLYFAFHEQMLYLTPAGAN